MKKKRKSELSKLSLDIILSGFVIVMGVLLVFWVWVMYSRNQRENLKHNTILTGQLTAQQLHTVISSDIQRLENLKVRIEITSGDYFQYWSHDARILLQQNSSFRFIEWIDSTMVIRRVEPPAGNEEVVNLDIALIEYRRNGWLRHVADSTANITNWVNLTQGGQAFLVDIPVYYGNRFQGTITGGMDFTNAFTSILKDTEDYAVQLTDPAGTVFFEYNVPENYQVSPDLLYSEELAIDASGETIWTLQFFPRPQFIQSYGRSLGLSGLVVGLSISVLLGVISYYAQRASAEARRVHVVNKKLKRLNVALSEERKKADQASQTKTEFLANMSHEIRTPLNAILGFIEVLKNMELEEEKQKYLNMMDFSSKNLLSLVDDILEIDKIESGKLTLREEAFSPQLELQNLVQVFRMGFEEKGLSLDFSCTCTGQKKAIGDIGKFNQIITNLLRNSFKFTHEGGVTVRCDEKVEADRLVVEIRIKDTGIGIPENKLTTIFDRFAQVDSSLRRKHEGSGLGLAITYQLVQKMGGTISVSSESGKGSEFVVNLVLKRAEEKTVGSSINANKDVSFKGKKILIVEDNALNVMVLQKVLEQLNIETDVAENGIVALDKVAENHYDLVFMDVHMPELDGFEATRIIRKKNKELVIIGLSANVTKEALEEAQQVGMQDYMTKPFSRQKLIQFLTQYAS
ncbi:MAG: response regulator [Owenweeksia sp.]